MSCKRASKRSLDEWMEMVTACRQSGMTDADWCAEHGIAPSSFYNAVTRLRKQACQIPDPIKKVSTLDLTSRKQDVVRILRKSCFQIPWTVLCTLTIHIQLKSKRMGY